MRLEVRLGRRGLRRWHRDLLDRLGARPGVAVGLRWTDPAGPPFPSCIATLFALERLIHGLPEGRSAPLRVADFARFAEAGGVEPPDLVLDVSGEEGVAGLARTWRLTFDGAPGEAAALGALLAGRNPVVAV